jgi:AraC-like DNA-binding protein
MSATILASAARSLWRVAKSRNLDADRIFTEAGLDPALINQPRGRYPFQKVCQAAVSTARLADEPHLGIAAAEHYAPTDLHALGIAFLSSKNLEEAFTRLIRYESVMNSKVKLSLVPRGDRVDFICEGLELDKDAARMLEDVRAALLVDLCRKAVGPICNPAEVAFTYPAPKDTGLHFGYFRCPVTFSSGVSRLSFAREEMAKPLLTANHELARMNDQLLDDLLSSIADKDIVAKVKTAIIERLPSGTPTEDDIASLFCASPRTLGRRLTEQGASFRNLLKEARLELAERYIADPDIPITEISFLLGFSDTSSFSRAFKRWTGSPPAEYRSNNLG